ncbi:MAG: ADP-ribosylglycohydrolase family protein [Candidatus Hydrogenedentes bacterium]|nr:ADP-ribosylglycohydrolase family protein [Candidatus Hydrogenedentota bacterium]
MATKYLAAFSVGCIWLVQAGAAMAEEAPMRRLLVEDYRDKMRAAWIGQMAAVGWGQMSPRWQEEIMPMEVVPKWEPRIVNQFFQDDLYLDTTFLRTLEVYGLDVSIRQAGIDFANSGYKLWHANLNARENLRNGIAPPDSGHPQFNKHSDDIDYQIQADYSGLISPGLPNSIIRLGEIFGRLMNYGDGLYGGLFVGGMITEAFFTDDLREIVEAGLRCVPEGSQYHEAITDTLAAKDEFPDDWQAAWKKLTDKYAKNDDYRRCACFPKGQGNINAKLNGCFVVIGLLYGKGDLDNTITTAMRCGQDSDCTSSTAAGVLFQTVGYKNLPERYTSGLEKETKFSFSPYTFDDVIRVSEMLARQTIVREGGRIEIDEQGREVFVIPVQQPEPPELTVCWDPGPIANSRYAEGEMRTIVPPEGPKIDLTDALEKFAPAWEIDHCGSYRNPGYHDTFLGRDSVLGTHPLDEKTPCVIFQKVLVPEGKKTTLRFMAGHDHPGDWQLGVKVDGGVLLDTNVGKETATDNWLKVELDLSAYAGKEVLVELTNAYNTSGTITWEAAFWDDLEIVSE